MELFDDGALLELLRTATFALWALVVYLAVAELKRIRLGLVGDKPNGEGNSNLADRLAKLERSIALKLDSIDRNGSKKNGEQ